MKVHLVKKQSIGDYVRKNVGSRASFVIWLSIIKRVDWNEPNNIISTFNSTDILGGGSDRVVFTGIKMGTLKYTVIKAREQYEETYCDILENLVLQDEREYQDEIELVTLLIEKWDNEHNTFNDSDPI